MAAYLIVDYYEIFDPEQYQEYSRIGSVTVRLHGGTGLAGTDHVEVLEGNWKPRRLVLIEFENPAQAKDWYESEEYRKAVLVRRNAANCNIILVEGN
jgi:uncharacterized protein (DUF1330 family)